MKAVGLYNIGDIRLIDTEIPRPGPGEILVQVRAATTCGTDLKTFLRGRPTQPFPTIPWGHECSGVVAEIGSGVHRFQPGDPVAIHNSAPCHHCFFCKREQYELCENLVTTQGAYAEYMLVPAEIVDSAMFDIPEHVSFEIASLLEPFACSVHGAARARIEPGDHVGIIGAGFQGLCLAQLARLQGAATVCVIDLVESRLRRIEELVDIVPINASTGDVSKFIRGATAGRGCDCVIEAAGTPQTWELAIGLARKGGRVVEYGGCKGGTTITVETERLHYEGLEILGVFHTTPRYVQRAWDLITTGAVQLASAITSRARLDDIQQVYETLRDDKGELKIALAPRAATHNK